MIGSFLTRGLVMMFGYAYPAYECFKVVEMNKPAIEQLRFWCQYWVPMYSEAKLAFFLYLWYPKTKGTSYVYDCFYKPFISSHEAEIDRSLVELRVRAEDLAVSYSQTAVKYFQTRIFSILQSVASQSTPHRPSQPQQQAAKILQPPVAPSCQPSITKQQTDQLRWSLSSTSGSSQDQQDTEEEVGSSKTPAGEALAMVHAQKTTSTQAPLETAKDGKASEVEAMQIDSLSAPVEEIPKLIPSEMMVEGVRITRARSRRTHSVATR